MSEYEEEDDEPEESPEDSVNEISSTTDESVMEINTYDLRERQQVTSDQGESDKIDTYLKPRYYSSSEEMDSDDERIQEKLRRKRYLKKISETE